MTDTIKDPQCLAQHRGYDRARNQETNASLFDDDAAAAPLLAPLPFGNCVVWLVTIPETVHSSLVAAAPGQVVSQRQTEGDIAADTPECESELVSPLGAQYCRSIV